MASPVKSPKAVKKTGPKTLDIVIEAIKSLEDRKGASIQAIKTYILTTYPEKDPAMIKTSMKKAIQKGFDEELLVRPKNSENQGPSMSGRLKLNKAKFAENDKAAKAKAKKAEKKVVKPKTAAPTKKTSTKKSVKETSKKSPKKKVSDKAAKSKSVKTPVKSAKRETKTKAKPKAKTPEKNKAKKVTKTPMKKSKSAKTKGKA